MSGAIFGIVFTGTGLLTLIAWGSFLLSAIGLLPPQQPATAMHSFRDSVIAFCGLLILGIGHLAIGTILLCTRRTTFDRLRGIVIVRRGWLGIRVHRESLSHFHEVVIERVSDRFNIVLTGEPNRKLLVGVVTLSHPLAHEVATEIGGFIGLPRHV